MTTRQPWICSLVLLTTLFGACASQPPVGDVKVLKQPGQRAWPGAGLYGALSDNRHNVGIRIWDANFNNGAADCTVWVKNNSNRQIWLSTENVQLVGAQSSLPVLGKSEMLAQVAKDIEGRSIWSSLTGITEVLAANNKGYSTHTGTFEGNTEYGQVDGTYSGTSYDPSIAAAARQAAVDKQQAREQSIRSDEQRRRTEVASFYFDQLDIPPGGEQYGGFRFSLPKASQKMRISVTIDGETHTFDLSYTRTR